MPPTTRSRQNKNIQNDNEPDTSNNNNLSSSPNQPNLFDNLSSGADSPTANFATTSKVFATNTETSSEIPPGVKLYIDSAFEKQTLEIRALFQCLQNRPLLPLNTLHDSDNDHNANEYQNINRSTIPNNDNHNDNNESGRNTVRRTSKRTASRTHKDNNNSNNINNNNHYYNNNDSTNKKLRPSQGEHHTNTATSLIDAENMLRDHTQGNIPNVTFPLPKMDTLLSRPFAYVSPPIHEQSNRQQDLNNTAPPSADFTWFLQTYTPTDYKNTNYDPKFELDQLTNPIAKETESTRLWWTTNFKKDGWIRILNKPSKPANIPRSIWQTVAYNQFMELTLLSQNSVQNFTKANNNTFDTNLDDDTRTVVILQPSQTIPFNNDSSFQGQARRLSNNLYFSTWHEWYMAWKLYTDLVLIIYPHRVGEFQGYISILTEFSKDFHLQAVMRYDRDRRIKLAEKRDSTLLDREPSVEGKNFTAAAARIQYIQKQQQNSYSRSSNFRSPLSKTIFHEGFPICKEFNRKDGCKRDICRYKYVCFICRLRSHGESFCYRLQQNKTMHSQPSSSKTTTDAAKH